MGKAWCAARLSISWRAVEQAPAVSDPCLGEVGGRAGLNAGGPRQALKQQLPFRLEDFEMAEDCVDSACLHRVDSSRFSKIETGISPRF